MSGRGAKLDDMQPVQAADDLSDQPSYAPQTRMSRLADMQYRLSDLIDDLLGADPRDLEAIIEKTFAHLGGLMLSGRVSVHLLGPQAGQLAGCHEWRDPQDTRLANDPAPFSMEFLTQSGWLDRFRVGDNVLIRNASSLPSGSGERQVLEARGVGSFLAVPLRLDGDLCGFIGFEMARASRVAMRGEIELIRPVATVLCRTLARHDDHQSQARIHTAALNTQRSRLNAVLQAMPDLVMEVSSKGRFIAWHSDPQSIPPQLAGLKPGRPLADMLSPDLAYGFHQALMAMAMKGGFSHMDIWLGQGADRRGFEVFGSLIDDTGCFFILRDVSEKLKQSQQIQTLSEIARRTTNIALVADRERRVEWVNDAFVQLTGWHLEDVRGERPLDFLGIGRLNPGMAAHIASRLGAGQGVQAEVRVNTRFGQELWLSLDLQPLREAGGEVHGFVVVGNDITELRNYAAALEEAAGNAAHARSILEGAVNALEDGFVLFDADDRLVICNERYREINSNAREILEPGVSFREIVEYQAARSNLPDDRVAKWVEERLAQRRLPNVDFEMQTAAGRWLRVFDRSLPDGGRVGLRIDITSLKRAEEQANADRVAALDASQDGIAFTDGDGRIVYMNRAHLEMFGYDTESEVLGQPWEILYDAETREWINTHAAPQVAAIGHWSGELDGLDRDGQPVEQEVSLTRQPNGGIMSITRDIAMRHREEAERNRLREELQISRRREIISQMAAGLAHDFSNVLATISGGASLIERSAEPGSQTQNNAQRLQAASQQAESLVRRLLRLGAGRSEPMLLDLRDPVREAVDLVRVGLRKPTNLRLETTDQAMNVVVDPTDVLQVVLNLAINARDSLPLRSGEITVTLRPATPEDLTGPVSVGKLEQHCVYYCMIIGDNGSGMPPDVAARVFNPYFSTKGNAGTGLGLSVVASILRAHGGAVRVESVEGSGSTFTVFWRGGCQADMSGQIDDDLKGLLKGRLDGRLILLVDDLPEVLNVMAQVLELAGAEVATTDVSLDALDAIRENPEVWDAVITDYDMPGMNGAELAEEIRKMLPHIPILLISSHGRSHEAGAGIFDVVLDKPARPSQLVRIVEEQIQKPKGSENAP